MEHNWMHSGWSIYYEALNQCHKCPKRNGQFQAEWAKAVQYKNHPQRKVFCQCGPASGPLATWQGPGIVSVYHDGTGIGSVCWVFQKLLKIMVSHRVKEPLTLECSNKETTGWIQITVIRGSTSQWAAITHWHWQWAEVKTTLSTLFILLILIYMRL
jgi:hypothetical protein